jgi:septal ring-binding cell division protein DamX
MNHPASREPRFFVTPQAANLMEDMSRQLMQGDDVCVLHGQPGCGKTRLLQHFRQSYLAAREVREVILRQDGFAFAGDAGQLDLSGFSARVLEPLPQHCVLILDQMENADDNLREALFRFWQTEGIKRRCRLLLSIHSAGLGNLATAAQRSRIHLLSIELKPWGKRAVWQFLNRQLCKSVDEQLKVNSAVRRQLNLTQGLPGAVEQVAQRLDGQIDCRPRRGGLLNYLLVSILVGVVLAALYWTSPALWKSLNTADVPDSTRAEKSSSVTTGQVIGVSAESKDQGQAATRQTSNIVSQQAQADPEEATVERSEVNRNRGDKTLAEGIEADSGSMPSDGLQGSSVEPNLTLGVMDSRVDAALAEDLLTRRIQATRGWLAKSSGKRATIQIMSVNYQTGAVAPLEAFLDELVDAGVDAEKLFVYQVKRASGHIYVVLFGEFEGRREAFNAIKDLPPVLTSNDPIPRTISSIKMDISTQRSTAS